MLNKILCFFLGHKTGRLNHFKDSSLIQVIDDKEGLIMKVEYCPRCGAVHGSLKPWPNNEASQITMMSGKKKD